MPTRDAGPPEVQGIPTVPEAGKVLVPPQDYSLPRLCYQLAWHRDRPAEGTNIQRLATILLSQGLAMFSVTISYH